MLSNSHNHNFVVHKRLECILALQMQGRIQNNVQINDFRDICDRGEEKANALKSAQFL
jgi:hypothetical protein